MGIGFAIPINMVKRFIPDLVRYGQVRYPYMGVSVKSITPRLAQVLKLPVSRGLMVLKAYRGGAAANAGIRGGTRSVYIGNYQLILGGDIILSVDNRPMKHESDLIYYLEANKRVGDSIRVKLLRRGRGTPVTVNIRLQARRR